MPRERQVYLSAEIPHLWAHGRGATETKGGIRNQADNLYCSKDGRTIYSYGSHFPIARRIETKRGVSFLITTRRYSATTDRHIRMVKWAAQGLGEVYHIDPNNGDRYARCEYWDAIEKRKGYSSLAVANWYADRIKPMLTKAANSRRIRHETRRSLILRAAQIRDDWVRLHNDFQLACGVDRVPEIPEDIDAIRAQQRVVDEKARVARERREAARRGEVARRQAEALKILPVWRDTGEHAWGIKRPGKHSVGVADLPYPVLRIDDGSVRTSKRARVPVDAARALLRAIPHFSLDTLYPRNVGPYRGVKITSTELCIGCHRIPWDEVFAFCDHYKWDKPKRIGAEAAKPA